MEKIALLAGLPLFQGLERRELEKLASMAFARAYDDGDILVQEGVPGGVFFAIVSGRAEVMKGLGRAGATILARLGPGDYFGEMAILEQYVRSASVVARGPVECLLVAEWNFIPMLESNPKVCIKLLRVLSRRLRETSQMLMV